MSHNASSCTDKLSRWATPPLLSILDAEKKGKLLADSLVDASRKCVERFDERQQLKFGRFPTQRERKMTEVINKLQGWGYVVYQSETRSGLMITEKGRKHLQRLQQHARGVPKVLSA